MAGIVVISGLCACGWLGIHGFNQHHYKSTILISISMFKLV